MTQKRQALEFDLEGFTPRTETVARLPNRKAVEKVTSFPSREAPDDDQINIKGPKAVLDRFRTLRKSERYKYADLLEFMMDAYEERQKKGSPR